MVSVVYWIGFGLVSAVSFIFIILAVEGRDTQIQWWAIFLTSIGLGLIWPFVALWVAMLLAASAFRSIRY